MDGLFSYNRLYASDGTTEVKDYVYRFDESTIDGDKGIIDPLANIIALDVTSQQNENLISDYMLAFDYNISVDDVTIEKKVVKDGKTTYENSLYATEDAAKAGDAKALAADYKADRAMVVDLVVGGFGLPVARDDPVTGLLKLFDGKAQIGHLGHLHVVDGPGRDLGDGRVEGGVAPLLDDDPVDAEGIGGAQYRPHVMGIFDAI